MPRMMVAVAERVYPTPGAVEFEEATTADRIPAPRNGQPTALQQYQADVMRQYGVTRIADLPINFRGLQLQRSEEESNVVWDRHFGALWATYERQNTLRRWASFLVPTMAARDLAMAAAGTTVDHHRVFAAEAERYRRRMVRTLNLALANNSRTGQQYKADNDLWASIPEFEPPTPSLWWSLRTERLSAGALALWIVGFAMFVVRARLAPLHRS